MKAMWAQKNYTSYALKSILIGVIIMVSSYTYAQKPWYTKTERSWADSTQRTKEPPAYTVYLIGDAGEYKSDNPSALKILEGHLKNADTNSIVVLLGDNIYPAGLPKPDAENLKTAQKKINAQLDILKSFKGRVVFVPGNHDWDHWSKEGLEGIKREEDYVEKYLDRGNVFLPDNGCPGPSVVNLTENLVLVSIDTQWWLHKWRKTDASNKDCPAIDDASFLAELEAALTENKSKQIIVTAHHPIITNGNHGGYYALKDYIFPLTASKPNLYIPLPYWAHFILCYENTWDIDKTWHIRAIP